MPNRKAFRLLALASVASFVSAGHHRPGILLDGPAQAAAPARTRPAPLVEGWRTPKAVSDRITVTTIGNGADVILIPGLASSAHVWDATVDHLKGGHRVHVVQVAGFAGSEARANAAGPVIDPVVEAVHAYILAAGLKAPALIGHSLGGLVAMKLALAYPGDAGRIMIVDALPFFGMMFGPGATVAGVEPQAKAMRQHLLGMSQADFAAAEPAQMARLVKSKGPAAAAALEQAARSDPKVVGQALYDDLTTDLRGEIGRIAMPLTMLYPYDVSTGTAQATVDALYAGAFAPVKGAALKRIDGSYHFIMIDQPAAFLAEVDAFLK